MKNIIISIIVIIAIAIIGCRLTKVANSHDFTYERYCDSIWEANPEYYVDVLAETDEYCTYIEEHGEWWAE